MSDTTTPEQFGEELFELWPDGRVHLKVAGREMYLRRPKFKELRAIRESLKPMAALEREENERLRALAERQRRDATGTDDDGKPILSPMTEEELDESRQISDAREERMLRWQQENVLSVLGSFPAEGDAWQELPTWMARADVVRDLTEHWSSVPRRPGSR